jgi:hypothetical protein
MKDKAIAQLVLKQAIIYETSKAANRPLFYCLLLDLNASKAETSSPKKRITPKVFIKTTAVSLRAGE